MPQHLGAGVANEGQLVLVGSLDTLHQRGEGVSAAVGRVFAPLHSADLNDGIVNPTGFQGTVKLLPVFLNGQSRSVLVTEDRAGDLPFGETVNGSLDLRRKQFLSESFCFVVYQ